MILKPSQHSLARALVNERRMVEAYQWRKFVNVNTKSKS